MLIKNILIKSIIIIVITISLFSSGCGLVWAKNPNIGYLKMDIKDIQRVFKKDFDPIIPDMSGYKSSETYELSVINTYRCSAHSINHDTKRKRVYTSYMIEIAGEPIIDNYAFYNLPDDYKDYYKNLPEYIGEYEYEEGKRFIELKYYAMTEDIYNNQMIHDMFNYYYPDKELYNKDILREIDEPYNHLFLVTHEEITVNEIPVNIFITRHFDTYYAISEFKINGIYYVIKTELIRFNCDESKIQKKLKDYSKFKEYGKTIQEKLIRDFIA